MKKFLQKLFFCPTLKKCCTIQSLSCIIFVQLMYNVKQPFLKIKIREMANGDRSLEGN